MTVCLVPVGDFLTLEGRCQNKARRDWQMRKDAPCGCLGEAKGHYMGVE